MVFDITRKEAIIVSAVTIFSLIWSFLFIPLFSNSDWFITQLPITQFFLFNIGFVLIFIVVVGIPLSYVLKHEVVPLEAIKLGLASWLGVGIIYDMLQPPYYLNTSGEVMLDVPKALTGTSVDAMFAWLWSLVGVSGPVLFYCVYLLTPIIVVVLMAVLLTGKQFVSVFKKG